MYFRKGTAWAGVKPFENTLWGEDVCVCAREREREMVCVCMMVQQKVILMTVQIEGCFISFPPCHQLLVHTTQHNEVVGGWVMLRPCGFACVCNKCCVVLVECPMCRHAVSESLPVFLWSACYTTKFTPHHTQLSYIIPMISYLGCIYATRYIQKVLKAKTGQYRSSVSASLDFQMTPSYR